MYKIYMKRLDKVRKSVNGKVNWKPKKIKSREMRESFIQRAKNILGRCVSFFIDKIYFARIIWNKINVSSQIRSHYSFLIVFSCFPFRFFLFFFFCFFDVFCSSTYVHSYVYMYLYTAISLSKLHFEGEHYLFLSRGHKIRNQELGKPLRQPTFVSVQRVYIHI